MVNKLIIIICLISILGCSYTVDSVIGIKCKPTVSAGNGPALTPDGKVDPWSLTPGIKCLF